MPVYDLYGHSNEKFSIGVTVEMEVKEVCSFYLEGKCRFGDRCHNLHPVDLSTSGLNENRNHPVQDSKLNVETGKEEDASDHKSEKCKKPPMKTASDVISRIQWDSSLPSEHFVIGYLDRFLGILEQPFSVFDWSDLSSADYNALAIPKHRIQYFKYRGEKVWDKRERLDLVFGSTGSESYIGEVMDRVDAQVAIAEDNNRIKS